MSIEIRRLFILLGGLMVCALAGESWLAANLAREAEEAAKQSATASRYDAAQRTTERNALHAAEEFDSLRGSVLALRGFESDFLLASEDERHASLSQHHALSARMLDRLTAMSRLAGADGIGAARETKDKAASGAFRLLTETMPELLGEYVLDFERAAEAAGRGLDPVTVSGGLLAARKAMTELDAGMGQAVRLAGEADAKSVAWLLEGLSSRARFSALASGGASITAALAALLTLALISRQVCQSFDQTTAWARVVTGGDLGARFPRQDGGRSADMRQALQQMLWSLRKRVREAESAGRQAGLEASEARTEARFALRSAADAERIKTEEMNAASRRAGVIVEGLSALAKDLTRRARLVSLLARSQQRVCGETDAALERMRHNARESARLSAAACLASRSARDMSAPIPGVTNLAAAQSGKTSETVAAKALNCVHLAADRAGTNASQAAESCSRQIIALGEMERGTREIGRLAAQAVEQIDATAARLVEFIRLTGELDTLAGELDEGAHDLNAGAKSGASGWQSGGQNGGSPSINAKSERRRSEVGAPVRSTQEPMDDMAEEIERFVLTLNSDKGSSPMQ